MAVRRTSKTPRLEFPPSLTEIHKAARARGLDKMTMREINAVIAEVRREKDPPYGQVRRITMTLSERMYRQLKAAAAAEGWSLSAYIRQAIGERLEKRTSKQLSPKITKAISQSTERFKTGRYEN